MGPEIILLKNGLRRTCHEQWLNHSQDVVNIKVADSSVLTVNIKAPLQKVRFLTPSRTCGATGVGPSRIRVYVTPLAEAEGTKIDMEESVSQRY
ncbi:hypothetical protein TNCV_4406291 [Trichonephila clavipes]|nr:hypothetical protein TNCV_4406291 [Trichonephila clavipes]